MQIERLLSKPIATEAENESAIALDEELDRRLMRTPEEDLFLELLVTLIEKLAAFFKSVPVYLSSLNRYHSSKCLESQMQRDEVLKFWHSIRLF
ncbi:MAG: hypothetical protein KME17_08735 [Cyanosarcina radialis HA8281-LM2]|jgi:hypothetical protein|nr:hypothetical protein [Cyanosarcina radialis HA8281-LM2]